MGSSFTYRQSSVAAALMKDENLAQAAQHHGHPEMMTMQNSTEQLSVHGAFLLSNTMVQNCLLPPLHSAAKLISFYVSIVTPSFLEKTSTVPYRLTYLLVYNLQELTFSTESRV